MRYFRLDEKLVGGRTVKIELDQVVDLTAPGVERFMTLPLDQTEGCADVRTVGYAVWRFR